MSKTHDPIEQWLVKARTLRAELVHKEAEYFLFLVDSEATLPWQGAFSTFEQVCQDYDLCTAERFTRFRDALVRVPDRDLAKRIGIDAFTRGARVVTDAKRNVVMKELDLRTKAHGGPLSPRESERVVQGLAPVEKPARHVERAMAQDKLEQENRSLRKRVAELERENAELHARIAKLEGTKKKA